jgi:hypothetical protein
MELNVVSCAVWIIGSLYVISSVIAAVSAFLTDTCEAWINSVVLRNRRRAKKLKLLMRPSQALLQFARDEVIDYSPLCVAPEAFVEPRRDLTTEFEEGVSKSRRLLIFGESGAGKTTFAQEMCRRYLGGDVTIATPLIPVLVSLSNVNRIKDSFGIVLNLVASRIESRWKPYRLLLAKRLIRGGKLLIIFDGLDYLTIDEHQGIIALTQTWQKNSFVYLFRDEAPSTRRLKDFQRIRMPAWKREEGRAYLAKRFGSPSCANEVIQELDSRRVSKRLQTPLHWKCFADAYEEERVFELFSLEHSGPQPSPVDDSILDHYVTAVMKSANLGSAEALRKLGRLSLRLIICNKNRFVPEDSGLAQDHLDMLKGRLLKKHEGEYAFIHNNYQVLLAGKYVGEFWSEAEEELKVESAKSLIWTAVFYCAKRFIGSADEPSLRKRFKILSTH